MGLSGNDFCCPKTAPFSWLKQEREVSPLNGIPNALPLNHLRGLQLPSLARERNHDDISKKYPTYIYVEETYSYIYLYI